MCFDEVLGISECSEETQEFLNKNKILEKLANAKIAFSAKLQQKMKKVPMVERIDITC